MNRKHAVTISLAAGAAAIAGTFAATKTVQLGRPTATPPAASATVAQQTRQLDRAEVALRKALDQKPPALPPLPRSVGGAPQVAASTQQRVVYRRPAPIIRHVHRAGGAHEGELEAADGTDRGGGGFDD